jgi:hypothetical protein
MADLEQPEFDAALLPALLDKDSSFIQDIPYS